MEKSDIAPVITRLCDLQSQQFAETKKLVLALAAVRKVMTDRGDKDFQSDLQKKTHQLEQGELGRKIRMQCSAFDQELQSLKNELL